MPYTRRQTARHYQNDHRIILIFTMDLIPIVGYYFDNVIGPYLFHFSRSGPILFLYTLIHRRYGSRSIQLIVTK